MTYHLEHLAFLGYLFLINVLAFLAFAMDKSRARRKAWRIPEKNLIGLAAIGGSLGALLGMRFFHHKTKKPQFAWGIPVILLLQLGSAIMLWLL